ncbi:glutathione synthase/RimK-type ligase-like ATP-grasp enzyme, partial [Sphingomonas sp. SORGH_AS 950]|uniref:hypothetical protein n=1 Tax=Sphingomonas sp. SORGH_AS_0950 TaxID=3041792 RepID=UPI00277E80B7
MTQLTVFEWNAWDRFLITHAVPNAKAITVEPGSELRMADSDVEAAMIHVNLSRPAAAFPNFVQWRADLEARGRPVLNGYFESIDKWALQAACAAAGLPIVRTGPDGDPDELLVVKARANHYGRYERLLPAELTQDMVPPLWPYPERVHQFARKDLPQEYWHDSRITVERYIGNVTGTFQRSYVVGDYVAVATSHSDRLVKEMDQRLCCGLQSTQDASQLPLAPDNALAISHRLASELRVDFAALDLVLDDQGNVYPIDLNTTPVWGSETDLNPTLIAEVRAAFAELIERGGRFGPCDSFLDRQRA